MKRIPCRKNDSHQTAQVPELIKNGVQKGKDGKYTVNPNLPKKIKKIAFAPANYFLLVVFLTAIPAGLFLWRMFDPELWAKLPLSALSEPVGTYAPWAALAGVGLAVLLWIYWRPGYLDVLRMREEGVYCYADDEIFFEE